MTSGFSTQAYLWMAIYDSQHEKNVKLEKELTRTQQELRRKDEEYLDTMWTLHELSNGAGHAALNEFEPVPSGTASGAHFLRGTESHPSAHMACRIRDESRTCARNVHRPPVVSLQQGVCLFYEF
jgi:hypothetical protein